jgi:hypothetical protein
VREWQGRSLRYPVGVADLEALTGESFDLDSFRQVPLFFFLGARAEFHLYPDAGHTMTPKEFLDLRDFYAMVLAEEDA